MKKTILIIIVIVSVGLISLGVFFIFNENDFNLDTSYFVGSGKSADICAYDDGFAICYTDGVGNTFVRGIKTDGRGVFTQMIDKNSDCCAITYTDGSLFVATVTKGKIFVTRVSSDGSKSQPMQVKCSLNAYAVDFVKNSPTPMLIVYDGKRAIMKTAKNGKGATDLIYLTAIVNLSA